MYICVFINVFSVWNGHIMCLCSSPCEPMLLNDRLYAQILAPEDS
jgi:hypothetical protein